MTPFGRSGWRRPSRFIPLAVLGVVVFGAIGIFVASKTGLNRELANIRAKGLPTNPKELDAWYPKVPAKENAALKLLEARDQFVAAGGGRDPSEISWSEIPHDKPLEAQTVAILKVHLEKNATTLRLMQEASELQNSRYPMDLSRAPDLNFSHLIPVKNLSQLARWEAVYQAERGDASGALTALKSGFAICHTLAQEPLLISELVRLACIAIQMVGVERVVNVVSFDEAQLRELAILLQQAADDSKTSLHRAFIGERAFANTGRKYSFEEYEQMIGVGALVGVAIGGGGLNTANSADEWPLFLRKAFYYTRRGIGMHDRDHAFYMRSMGRLIEATALDHPDFLAESEMVTADLTRELTEHPIALELSGVSLPAMFYTPRKGVMLIARLNCALMALNIEAWRRNNAGALPSDEQLMSISTEFPKDPVDGSPIRFQRSPSHGYKVRAVAASARNLANNPQMRNPDITFEILK